MAPIHAGIRRIAASNAAPRATRHPVYLISPADGATNSGRRCSQKAKCAKLSPVWMHWKANGGHPRFTAVMELIFASTAPERLSEAAALLASSKREELVRVYRASYLDAGGKHPSSEILHAARAIAAARRNPNGVISGVSAAVLHGIPLLYKRLGSKIVITRANSSRPNSWVSPRKATLAESDITEKDGVRVTTVARTILDLAETLDRYELLAAADAVLRQGGELTYPTHSSRNLRKIRWVLGHASERSESIGESFSRAIFIDAGIEMPLLQATVVGLNGEDLGRVDFASPNGFIGEFDGKMKYAQLLKPGETSADAIMREKRREAAISDLGWKFTRWDWNAFTKPDALVARVSAALSRANELPLPDGQLRMLPIRRAAPPNWRDFFKLS